MELEFRSLKHTQLQVRPVFFYSEDHVRGHVLLCMLAYYVEWHLRRRLAPLLSEECIPAGPRRQPPGVGTAGRTTEIAQWNPPLQDIRTRHPRDVAQCL